MIQKDLNCEDVLILSNIITQGLIELEHQIKYIESDLMLKPDDKYIQEELNAARLKFNQEEQELQELKNIYPDCFI